MPVPFDTAQLAKLMVKSFETAQASDVHLAVRCTLVSNASVEVVVRDALLLARLNRSYLRAALEWGARYGMADAINSITSDQRPEVVYAVPFALDELRSVRELASKGSEPDDVARFCTRCQSPVLTPDELSMAELVLQIRRPSPSEIARLLLSNPGRIPILGAAAVDVQSQVGLTELLEAARDDAVDPSEAFLRRIASFTDDPRATQYLLDVSRRRSPSSALFDALAQLGTDPCIDRLVELLPRHTYQVSVALNRTRADLRVAGLLRVYRRPGQFRRYGAGLVLKFARSNGVEVRTQAVQALAKLGPTVVPIFEAIATDGSSKLRVIAIEGLALTGVPPAERPLRALLTDPAERVRKAAQLALDSLERLANDAKQSEASARNSQRLSAPEWYNPPASIPSDPATVDPFADIGASATVISPFEAGDSFAALGARIHSPVSDSETIARADAMPTAPRLEDASYFSVLAPLRSQRAAWFIVELWCHEETPDVFVRQQSRQFGWQPPRSFGPVAVELGAAIGIELRLPGFEIQERRGVLRWQGKMGVIGFAVRSMQTTLEGTHLGSAHISIEDIPIARVYFQVELGSSETRPSDCTANVLKIDSAFASYSSEDRGQVLGRIQGMQKILPNLDVFLDVISLRSGDRWEQSITDEIGRRDAFFLFWSRSARASRWVNYEWRTALTQQSEI